MSKTGLTRRDSVDRAGAIITTLGEWGPVSALPTGGLRISAVTPRKVVDPTGAGDAYRGGLISGLVRGVDIEQCARMGSVCASFAVECYGTQDYTFSREEFEERLNGRSR